MLKDLRPLVVCGPSGSGKSSLIKKLFAEHPTNFSLSVSHTTRLPRLGELNGREYHFITKPQFQSHLNDKDGFFLEHTEFSGNLYGTSGQAVKAVQNEGRVCVLDVELNGVMAFKASGLNARFVYVAPPGMEELKRRLEGRGTETKESLERRLEMAKRETEAAETRPELFNIIIVNDDLERAYGEFKNYIFQ